MNINCINKTLIHIIVTVSYIFCVKIVIYLRHDRFNYDLANFVLLYRNLETKKIVYLYFVGCRTNEKTFLILI